ncbi:MAG: hypothetical protein JXJ04_03970 [Spirochaetales bacterium]|nr:hypothetical protein [Spirochaetales bacterium]
MYRDNYFVSPQEAIIKITAFLRDENWHDLASYYDLSGSGIPPESLLSGSFFIRKEPPPAAHPGGFWRYKHPFPPGFSYSYHTEDEKAIITVYMEIRIDESEGCIQHGTHSFRMRKSEKGYKILPE